MQDLPETRASLIARLQQPGEQTAWVDFCAVYEAAVLSYARRKGLHEADARDTSQEVLAAVYKAIATWEDDGRPASFRRWLNRVTHNAVMNSLQRRARHNRTVATGAPEELLVATSECPPSAESTFDLDFRREVFRLAAVRVQQDVHETTWDAFHRTAVQGQTAAVVAEELGQSIGTVYTAKCRVMARLRKEVQSLLSNDLGELS